MNTILSEIFNEYEMQQPDKAACCSSCYAKELFENAEKELSEELSDEQEFEWGKKLRSTATGVLLKLMNLVADPDRQEQNKRQAHKDEQTMLVEDNNKPRPKQKPPSRELSTLQEIFAEVDNEWSAISGNYHWENSKQEFEGNEDDDKKDKEPDTVRDPIAAPIRDVYNKINAPGSTENNIQNRSSFAAPRSRPVSGKNQTRTPQKTSNNNSKRMTGKTNSKW